MFNDFIEHICSSIEQDNLQALGYDTDDRRWFIWDNLNSHLSPLVAQTVEACNGNCHFGIVARPPYQPKYGPTEYVICDTACQLADVCDKSWDITKLEQELPNVFAQLRGFDNTFDHCGYTINGNY